MVIRNATQHDLSALRTIAQDTNMFIGEELDAFVATMEEHFALGESSPAALLVATEEGTGVPVGAAYFAPEMMAQGVMNLLFIGVASVARRRGVGAALLGRFEQQAHDANSRLAIIETASADQFAPAWALYRGHGYDLEARVRDYYDSGLDKLTFRKALK